MVSYDLWTMPLYAVFITMARRRGRQAARAGLPHGPARGRAADGPKCRWRSTAASSIFHPAWRSPLRSKPAPAASSNICSRQAAGCTNDNVLPGANGTKRREVKNGDGTAWSSVQWRLIPRARKPITGR
jgi:hypothetical protein